MTPEDRNAELEAENQRQREQIAALEQVSIVSFPAEASSRAQYGARVRALAVYLVQEQHVPFGRVQQLLTEL